MAILFDGINHPTAQQVINAGCVGALMYGGTPGDSLGKDFTAAQYADYKAHGLVTAFVFENLANDMAGGFNGGAAHARALLADLTSKGVRNTEPVGATVDEHVVVANIPLAVAYQNGFWSAVKGSGWAGPVGGYGFSEFLIAIHDAGVADWYWGAGTRSSMPSYTNVWQDNTGTILVGGSADDRDWILVPLPGGTMDWSDPIQNPIYDPANKNPADERSRATYTAAQYIQGPWVRTLTLPAQLAQITAQLTSLQGALTADEARLVGLVQGVDSDTKAGVLQVVAAISAGPTGAVDVKTLAAALAPLLPADASPAAIGEAVVAAFQAHLATTPPAGGTP